MGVSIDMGTPKSSILMGFSETNHLGVPPYQETAISRINHFRVPTSEPTSALSGRSCPGKSEPRLGRLLKKPAVTLDKATTKNNNYYGGHGKNV